MSVDQLIAYIRCRNSGILKQEGNKWLPILPEGETYADGGVDKPGKIDYIMAAMKRKKYPIVKSKPGPMAVEPAPPPVREETASRPMVVETAPQPSSEPLPVDETMTEAEQQTRKQKPKTKTSPKRPVQKTEKPKTKTSPKRPAEQATAAAKQAIAAVPVVEQPVVAPLPVVEPEEPLAEQQPIMSKQATAAVPVVEQPIVAPLPVVNPEEPAPLPEQQLPISPERTIKPEANAPQGTTKQESNAPQGTIYKETDEFLREAGDEIDYDSDNL